MSETNLSIESYLDEIGVKKYKNLLQFWSAIDTEYGLTRARELESVYKRLDEGDHKSFYNRIFSTYDTGIAFASLRHGLYTSFLGWFEKNLSEKEKPEHIIDVGCGNGILSCYLALRFPDAHISGFDISKEGIECAIKLAQKLNLKNTDFIVADAHCQDDKLDSRKADLIISVASLGLSQSESDDGVESSIYERYQKDSAKMRSTALELIASRLDENSGMFVSFDKVKDARAQISWAAQIQNSHLAIDIENCNWIRYVDIESETISLPVFVCRKETNIKKAGYNELIAFLLTDEERCTDLMIEGDQGLFAETIFSRLSPRQFIKGARAEYHDGGGTYWCEIWQAGPFLLTFEHTNHGYRTLKSHSLLRRTECLEAFKTWVDDSRKYADVKLLESPDISFELKSESDVEA